MKNNSDGFSSTIQIQKKKKKNSDYSNKDEALRKAALEYEIKQQKSIMQFLKNSFLK